MQVILYKKNYIIYIILEKTFKYILIYKYILKSLINKNSVLILQNHC